jgi:hypothetical protein
MELTGNEDRPQFDKFMWERKEKSGRLGEYSGGRFRHYTSRLHQGFISTLGWQRPRRVAAATIMSTPTKNSELADLPGRTLRRFDTALLLATPLAASLSGLRSISLRSDSRPRNTRERIVPMGTSRIVAASSYDVPLQTN